MLFCWCNLTRQSIIDQVSIEESSQQIRSSSGLTGSQIGGQITFRRALRSMRQRAKGGGWQLYSRASCTAGGQRRRCTDLRFFRCFSWLSPTDIQKTACRHMTSFSGRWAGVVHYLRLFTGRDERMPQGRLWFQAPLRVPT